MRILVVGAGATGGYFGGRLLQAGREVIFLVRAPRATALKEQGLQIISPYGNAVLSPAVVTADSISGAYDVVMLAVKAFSLDMALDDIAPAISPKTMILPLLNGMKHLDTIRVRFGENALVGCVCKVGTVVDDQGRIVQLNNVQELVYGELSGIESPRIRQLHEEMQNTGFPARLSGGIAREMWEKWIYIATVGGITCMMRGTVGQIEAAPGGLDFSLQFLNEVVTVASAAGEKPTQTFLAEMKRMLSEKGSKQASSMYRDLQAGRPLEAEQIIGDLLARAQKLHIPTPLLATAYTHLAIYQSGLPSGS